MPLKVHQAPPEEGEQVLAQRDVRSPALASQLRQVLELGELLDVIATNVSLQKESVKFVHGAAEESLENVRAGNEELMEATKRPSSLRDAAVVLLLSLWALILFLDWFNP